MTRIADQLMRRGSQFLWDGNRLRVDNSMDSYHGPSSMVHADIDLPERVAGTDATEAGVRQLFASSIKIRHITVESYPQFSITLGDDRAQVRQMVRDMTRDELSQTTVSFDGTIAQFAGDKTDKVVERLQSSTRKISRQVGTRSSALNNYKDLAQENMEHLSAVGPTTKLTFVFTGPMLKRLVQKGRLLYPALKALRGGVA